MSLEQAQQELDRALTSWRDYGGPVEDVVKAVLRLAVLASGGKVVL